MKDELFTMMPEMPGVPPEMARGGRRKPNRNFLRMKHCSEMVMNPKEPEVGPTPREEIYRKNKSRLYRYASKRTYRTPLLFVPNLGISRPYIFDLMPKGSFIEHMTQQGFDFYLVDWGVFGPEDNGLTVEDAVTKILPRLAREGARIVGGARDVGARLLHGRAAVGVLPRNAPRVSREELRRHGGAHRLLPGRDSSASGSTRGTSTSTSTWTPSAASPPTWSSSASSSSSRRWTSAPT